MHCIEIDREIMKLVYERAFLFYLENILFFPLSLDEHVKFDIKDYKMLGDEEFVIN